MTAQNDAYPPPLPPSRGRGNERGWGVPICPTHFHKCGIAYQNPPPQSRSRATAPPKGGALSTKPPPLGGGMKGGGASQCAPPHSIKRSSISEFPTSVTAKAAVTAPPQGGAFFRAKKQPSEREGCFFVVSCSLVGCHFS